MRSLRVLAALSAALVSAAAARSQAPAALRGKSVTVLPVQIEVAGQSAAGDLAVRIAEVQGLMLENAGMSGVAVTEEAWSSAEEGYAVALSRQVRAHSPATDTVLGVRMTGARSLERIDWALCGRDGAVLARAAPDAETPPPGNPMEACLAVARALQGLSDLGSPTDTPATEGPMARRMRERSGLPPPAEVEEAKARLAGLRGSLRPGCAVYPVRVAGPDQADPAAAVRLAERLDAAGLGPATPVHDGIALEVAGDPNQLKVLWDTARAFRAALRAHPADQPYALLVECGPVPDVRYVHLFLCERDGGWVVVDMQNSHHQDFHRIAPDSLDDCLDLAVLRLKSRIQPPAAADGGGGDAARGTPHE